MAADQLYSTLSFLYILRARNNNNNNINSQPLLNMEFMAIESWAKRKEIEKIVEKLGGKVVQKIHSKLAAIISNQETLDKNSKIIQIAKGYNIQVVSENFLVEAQHSDPLWYIKNYSLSDWGSDVSNYY